MPWRTTGVALDALPAGSKREITIEGKAILLVRLADAVHAVDGICPHEGGILGEGKFEGTKVTCPEHSAQYDLTDGRVLADPDGIIPPQGGTTPLVRFETRVNGGFIEVTLA